MVNETQSWQQIVEGSLGRGLQHGGTGSTFMKMVSAGTR